MTHYPYGFDVASLESSNDDPWTKLYTINEHLEAGELVPPYLAQWLGLAIRHCGRDANELLRRLELKRSRGRQVHKHAADAWITWGKRINELERTLRPEQAIDRVEDEYRELTGCEVARSQLQHWRQQYRAAEDEARCR